MKDDDSKRVLSALGQRIRSLRNEQGYSQEGFADKCRVHRTFMGTVERGESNLSFDNIHKISSALGLTLAVLFTGIEGEALAQKTPMKKPKRSKAATGQG